MVSQSSIRQQKADSRQQTGTHSPGKWSAQVLASDSKQQGKETGEERREEREERTGGKGRGGGGGCHTQTGVG
jgi:hypothetical protein